MLHFGDRGGVSEIRTPTPIPPRPSLQAFCTFFDHADDEALLKATVLAPIPAALVHGAVFVR